MGEPLRWEDSAGRVSRLEATVGFADLKKQMTSFVISYYPPHLPHPPHPPY